MTLPKIRMWAIACGVPALVLLRGTLIVTHAISFPSSYFDTVIPEVADEDLIASRGVEGNDMREAGETIKVGVAQILCLTECSFGVAQGIFSELIVSLLNPVPVRSATRNPSIPFPTAGEATSPHFDYSLLAFEDGFPALEQSTEESRPTFVLQLLGGTLGGVLAVLLWLLRREERIQDDLDRYMCETKAATSRVELEQVQERLLRWQERHPQCVVIVSDLLRYIDWRLKHNYPLSAENALNAAAATALAPRPDKAAAARPRDPRRKGQVVLRLVLLGSPRQRTKDTEQVGREAGKK